MKLPKFLKSFIARIAKYLTEVSAVTDETLIGSDGAAALVVAAPAATPAAVDVAVFTQGAAEGPTYPMPAPVAPAPVLAPEPAKPTASALIAKLEAALTAMGHELPVFWDEAVALAKKAV
jgi:hypothetical protein